MMKQLALLAFACFAFTSEATAEDPQYVRERAQMVKTIQAYAQIDIGLSMNKGISERVLDAMRQTKRHLFIPERFRSPCAQTNIFTALFLQLHAFGDHLRHGQTGAYLVEERLVEAHGEPSKTNHFVAAKLKLI